MHTLGGEGASSRVRVRLRAADESAVRSRLTAVPDLAVAEALPAQGIYVLESAKGAAYAIRALVESGFAVEEATPADSGLEELFLATH